jgi:DNA polymerase (family 10)
VDFLERSAVLDVVRARSDDVVEATTHANLPVVFHLAGSADAGRVLVAATGPEEHLAGLGDLSSRPTEADVYRDSGVPWTPPPARHLPLDLATGVVRTKDIRGDLHLHTDASPDGRMTIETILGEAVDRGYEYVLITDHTLGLRFGGLGAAEIADQARAIELLRDRFPELTLWHGAELNIGPDGSLDLDDATLDQLDFAVAGVHSHFGLTGAEQTARVSAALSHPVVRVLAHPFGRRIGIRPGLDIDMDAVIATAIRHDVALETNGHRDRLDLPADWVAAAAGAGALFAANSDAHRLAEMGNVANAVATLQRAGVTAEQVINARQAATMSHWISGRSSSA